MAYHLTGTGPERTVAVIADRDPAALRCWVNGAFAARFLLGTTLAGGHVVGQRERQVHLFPIPDLHAPLPDTLRAYCGVEMGPRQGELARHVDGPPCLPCLILSP